MKFKIVNEKGKLFGIINIIDLIVLAVIAALIFAGVKFMRNGGFAFFNSDENAGFMGPKTTLQMKFYSEEVSTFVADQLEEGAYLYDESSLEVLGRLTAVERKPSETYVTTADGNVVKTSKEDYESVMITGEVDGQRTPLGATVGKTHYASGHTFILRAGDAKIYLRVYSVEAKPRRLRRPLSEGSQTFAAA